MMVHSTLARLGLFALMSSPGLTAPAGPVPVTPRASAMCDDPNASWYVSFAQLEAQCIKIT